MGSSQTLVLIDGRRLPSLPSIDNAFLQSDISGVPLSAIDRIEVLTATSGGVYGAGAVAGAVNIVLKRDYRGADLAVTYGDTSRFDAATKRVDGRIGFTPDGGRTDVMRIAAHSHRDNRTAVVVSGVWRFGYGRKADGALVKILPPGSFYSEPAGVDHFAMTGPEGASVYISGFGPTSTDYVEAANAPKP